MTGSTSGHCSFVPLFLIANSLTFSEIAQQESEDSEHIRSANLVQHRFGRPECTGLSDQCPVSSAAAILETDSILSWNC